jgi:superfamily II DNA/RNA helicase
MEDPQSRRDYKIRSPKDASLVAQDDGPAERPVVSTIEATATRDSIFGNKSWEAIGLSAELQTAVKALGFHKPTLIQQLAIPTLSSSLKDVMFADQTGTGKTLAYLLPIFQALRDDERKNGLVTQPNRPRALVILPSKELAEQVTVR